MTGSKGDETQQNTQVALVNGGLYADCKINDIDTECLIDTDATLSVLSLKALDIISQSSFHDMHYKRLNFYNQGFHSIWESNRG